MRTIITFAVASALWLPLPSQSTPLDLHRVPVGATVEVPGFEFGLGKRFSAPLTLRRIEVYAPEAKLLLPMADGRMIELPRSDRRYFIAERSKTASRLFLSVSADGSEVSGSLFNAEQTYDFRGVVVGDALQMQAFHKSAPGDHHFDCASDAGLHGVHDPKGDALADAHFAHLKAVLPKGGTHQAVLAIDTDNELLNLRFSDNTSAATTYLADLITGMNVAYGPDLGFNLVQGTTVLRAQSVGGADPYSSSDTFDQLAEVGEQWATAPLLAENRAFVAFLSGKSPGTNSGSGVAWVLGSGAASNFCTAKDVPAANTEVVGHYSATQIIRGVGFSASVNVNLVGHEIGHNLGAFHTHCSNRTTGAGTTSTNTIDQCFSGEGGCYSGPTSCPTDNSVNLRGSLMSYCNFPNSNGPGASCGPTLNEFHPAHQTLIAPRVASNVGNGCFAALVTDQGPALTPTPAHNSTTAMPTGNQGQVVTRNITFAVSGGSGDGTTQLACSGSGAVSVASGTPQTIAVNGSANPVVAQLTLNASLQNGAVSCTATRSGGGGVSNFTFNFTAQPGAEVCSGNCIFRNGFE